MQSNFVWNWNRVPPKHIKKLKKRSVMIFILCSSLDVQTGTHLPPFFDFPKISFESLHSSRLTYDSANDSRGTSFESWCASSIRISDNWILHHDNALAYSTFLFVSFLQKSLFQVAGRAPLFVWSVALWLLVHENEAQRQSFWNDR